MYGSASLSNPFFLAGGKKSGSLIHLVVLIKVGPCVLIMMVGPYAPRRREQRREQNCFSATAAGGCTLSCHHQHHHQNQHNHRHNRHRHHHQSHNHHHLYQISHELWHYCLDEKTIIIITLSTILWGGQK